MVFVDVETTFRRTFPSSDLHCLPSDDPRVLCANMGIQIQANHLLEHLFKRFAQVQVYCIAIRDKFTFFTEKYRVVIRSARY